MTNVKDYEESARNPEEAPEESCPNSNCQSLNVVYRGNGWYECEECGQKFKLPLVGEIEGSTEEEE